MNHIQLAIDELNAEIKHKQSIVTQLTTLQNGTGHAAVKTRATKAVTAKVGKKRKLTAAGREAIRAAVARRWAKVKSAKK